MLLHNGKQLHVNNDNQSSHYLCVITNLALDMYSFKLSERGVPSGPCNLYVGCMEEST